MPRTIYCQNPNATLPTLVVDGKTYVTTAEVIDYLVKHAPRKVAAGTSFIETVHDEAIDPNFPMLIAVSRAAQRTFVSLPTIRSFVVP